MPSTDRLLWLLQMALFLAVPAYLALLVAQFLWGSPVVDCGTWMFTDQSGQQIRLTGETCPSEGGVIDGIGLFVLWWLLYAGLGAVVFCLGRIGKAMGAD